MWVVVRGLLLLPVLLCYFSTIRRDINSLPWHPFSVTISLPSRLWEKKPVYVLLCARAHTHTHTPLTQMGKVQYELCKRKRCYNHSSVTGLVKSASWIVINYAAIIFVLWALCNDPVNCDYLALRSGVVDVFVLEGCDALSHCNRFPEDSRQRNFFLYISLLDDETTTLLRIVRKLPSDSASYLWRTDAVNC